MTADIGSRFVVEFPKLIDTYLASASSWFALEQNKNTSSSIAVAWSHRKKILKCGV